MGWSDQPLVVKVVCYLGMIFRKTPSGVSWGTHLARTWKQYDFVQTAWWPWMWLSLHLLFLSLWGAVSVEVQSTLLCKKKKDKFSLALVRPRYVKRASSFPLHRMVLKESCSDVCNILHLFVLSAHNSALNRCFTCTVMSKNITRDLEFIICPHTRF